MLKISEDAIRHAFQVYQDVYGRRGWGVQEYLPLWDYGRRAFQGSGDRESFAKLYMGLRRGWLVFRTSMPNAATRSDTEVFDILSKLGTPASNIRNVKLSAVDDPCRTSLRRTLEEAAAIKLNKGGPSLVAVSKFLHFWNPGLFVIVDNLVMDSFVFQQAWLYDEIAEVNREIVPEITNAAQCLLGPSTHFYYEAILLWASRLLRSNKEIPVIFAEFAKEQKVEEPEGGFAQFEAAAIEMLLLGLANMPPAGVKGVGGAAPVRV